jgi:hypothetical protein
MVLYENGKKESFLQGQNQNQNQNQNLNQSQQVSQVSKAEVPIEKNLPTPIRKRYKANYFMIGTGYGNSYGGLGMRLQGRFGGKVGFGIHGGVGYFPGSSSVFAAGGFKFFPYKGLYIDTQFGLSGTEYYFESYSSGSHYSSSETQHNLYGPSVLIGIDQVWGRRVGIGFNIGLGASYFINAENVTNVAPAMDMGFLLRF